MEKYFSSQQDDEDVIMVIRKHWLELLPAASMALFIYFVGFAAMILLPVFFPVIMQSPGYNIYVVVLSLLFLYNTAFLFSVWLIHYLNVGIITTEHVVEISQESLFSRKISELGLDRIQDVSASQKGMSATMFNYGVVDIQTAGELPNFLFEGVPHPNETAQKIMELEEEYSKRHGIRGNGNIVNGQSQQAQQNIQPQEPGPNIEYPDQIN